MSGTAAINVTIEDVNDTPPRFAQDYAPSVVENSEVVAAVVSVSAVDDDVPASGPPFLYRVAGTPNEWNDYFTITGLGKESISQKESISLKVSISQKVKGQLSKLTTWSFYTGGHYWQVGL